MISHSHGSPSAASASSYPLIDHELSCALASDPAVHPERLNATLGRVREVLEIVNGSNESTSSLLSRCLSVAGDHPDLHEPMTTLTAGLVGAVLTSGLDAGRREHLTSLLWHSELATEEVIDLHKRFKIPVSHLEDDLLPVKGDGALIVDSKGKTYIDLDSNYSATNLGNANPEIALGLYNQACLLISQKEDRIQVARARFLKEFRGMMPTGLDRFYWQNSGGEAVDKALKIAKAYTGHTGVVAFEGGFHGRTHGAVAVTHNLDYRSPFGLDEVPWVHFAPFGDLDATESLLKSGAAKTVILELVQGEEAGIRPAGQAFAQGIRELCDIYGAVLIADEVQTGFGRTADGPDTWFASQLFGICPDIMAIGKSFGGGYPVTAVVTHQEISDAMRGGYDGSTFGGNPMAMTAALIATRQMKTLGLASMACLRGAQIDDALKTLASPHVKGWRTIGLMVGIDLESSDAVEAVQTGMMHQGVHSSLSTGATLRWMPPLVITEEQVGQVMEVFASTVESL